MNHNQPCLPPGLLGELIDGNVVEPDLSSFTQHLEECSKCQANVRLLFSSDSLVESLRADAAKTEQISARVPQPLIRTLKQIPALDLDSRASVDGLTRSRGMSLDDLGLSFLQPAMHSDEIGRLGHYRILEVLGRGGMGIVFLAVDPKLGRRVALKVMLPRIAGLPAARDRFLREARAAASLTNDHIVTVYQVDECNGVPFLAMELLQGESLEDALREGRRFNISETIRIARDIARGLADAHEKGLVHRDIKPGNLWLEQTPDGATRIRILDFGLARAEVEDINITEFGTIVGTPAFMAPEQARADRPIDGKADLFSLGCVLYVLCTGEIPFKAETTVGVLMALALNTPVAPNQRNETVPAELSRLTMQLLEKDPVMRPESARDVVERLREIERTITSASDAASGTLVGAPGETRLGALKPSSTPAQPAIRPARRMMGRGLKIATGLFTGVLAIILGALCLWRTPHGSVVRVESNDPSIMLAFAGGELKVAGAFVEPVALTPGKVDLMIRKPKTDGDDFEFETDKLIVRGGDEIVLKIEVHDGDVRIVQDGLGVIDSKPLTDSTEQYESLLLAMRQVNPGFDGAMVPRFENGRLVSLDFRTDNVTDISPLRELKYLRGLRMVGSFSPDNGISDLTPLQGLPLTGLWIYNSLRVTDLSPLKGMALQELHTDGCPIADFSPLAGMSLRILCAWSWRGSDLSPLRGMPLTELNIGGNGKPVDLTPLVGAPLEFLCCNSSQVSDLTPLKGMPLKRLLCENTLVSDLSPIAGAKLREFVAGGSRISDFSVLREMPLTWAKFDIVPERDLEILREITTLVRINDQRAADVLRELNADAGDRPEPAAFTNNIGMEFVKVPRGKAWLVRRESEERPMVKHETVFEQDFYLGAFEVTQEQWIRIMGSNPSWFTRNAEGADAVKTLPDDILKQLPVERVSWPDCQEFLSRLNEIDQQPGWVYRLPTEAEWQYACRGGPMSDRSEAEFEFYAPSRGQDLLPDHANFARELGWNRPCRIGLFAPNKLGLYDMHGNVAEWCDDKARWVNIDSRLLHASSWNDSAAAGQTSRIEAPPETYTYYDLGLRVARVPFKQ